MTGVDMDALGKCAGYQMTPEQIQASNARALRSAVDCGCCPIDEQALLSVTKWVNELLDGTLVNSDMLTEANSAYLFTIWSRSQ